MSSNFAKEVAAQCWCKPTTEKKVMDVELAEAFATVLDEYIDALRWCGGSADFGEGGQARIGWNNIVAHLISAPKATEEARVTSAKSAMPEIVGACGGCDHQGQKPMSIRCFTCTRFPMDGRTDMFISEPKAPTTSA